MKFYDCISQLYNEADGFEKTGRFGETDGFETAAKNTARQLIWKLKIEQLEIWIGEFG
jgi:hypothetical protein